MSINHDSIQMIDKMSYQQPR